MADNIYDLRKFNIKDMKDAMQFLELVEARIPQIVKVVRKQTLVEASLHNRLQLAENRPVAAPVVSEVNPDKNRSVLSQLTNPLTNQRPDASRIAQMKAAQTTEPDEAKQAAIKRAAAEIRTTGRPSAMALVDPGQIGQLDIEEPTPEEGLTNPGDTVPAAPVEPAIIPEVVINEVLTAPLVAEEDANRPAPVTPKSKNTLRKK